MRKTLTFKCLVLGVLVAMLLTGCANVKDYSDLYAYEEPQTVGDPIVAGASGAKAENWYAGNDSYDLYVDEVNATFTIKDKNTGNVWSSAPMESKLEDGQVVTSYLNDDTKSLVRVRYSHQIGPEGTPLYSYKDSVAVGKTKIYHLKNDVGVRFEFRFDQGNFVVPVQVVLHPQGVEISLLNKYIEEGKTGYSVTSVDVAPYFMATMDKNSDGYFMIPDGEGALVDWNNVPNSSVSYRQFVYGRDNAITIYEQKGLTQDIRLPVFGAQWKTTQTLGEDQDPIVGNRLGYTAIITQGAARAAMNFDLSKNYNIAYSEFIYRDIAKVKTDSAQELADFVERSKTTIPVQTVRYVLMADEALDYVDMADVYRNYLLEEEGVKKQTKEGSAPLVVELFGGMMKQQFVLGFPVDKVVPLTTYEDAGNIVKLLKEYGITDIVINYNQWQKDGTGAAIQTSAKAEGELGGEKALKNFLELCSTENISVYLNMNTNVMAKSAWGYDTSFDSTSTVRWDPAIQYYYNPNTGLPDMTRPLFMLAPTKLLDVANKMAKSAEKYNVTGVSSSVLGSEIYSDFAKRPTTRDVSEYIWNESLQALAGVTGQLLVNGGNAYALNEATFIVDAPMGNSDFLSMTKTVPFYQIVLHGVLPIATSAINEAEDVQQAYLHAIETGSYLKWNWTARNQDELVESSYNHQIASEYTNWIGLAATQYKEAQALLQTIATYTVKSHETVMDGVIRVVWTNGTNDVEVLVNYNDTVRYVGNTPVDALSFTWNGGNAA